MGLMMTLALHHDLNGNDLWKKNEGFDIEGFMEGAEPALERFQEVLYGLDVQNLPGAVSGIKDAIKVGETFKLEDVEMTVEKMQEVKAAIGKEVDWKAKAKEEPESLHGQLYGMVTEQLMNACERQFVESVFHCFMNQLPRLRYTLGSSEIQNVSCCRCRFRCRLYARIDCKDAMYSHYQSFAFHSL